jgi:hypothetical protein
MAGELVAIPTLRRQVWEHLHVCRIPDGELLGPSCTLAVTPDLRRGYKTRTIDLHAVCEWDDCDCTCHRTEQPAPEPAPSPTPRSGGP